MVSFSQFKPSSKLGLRVAWGAGWAIAAVLLGRSVALADCAGTEVNGLCLDPHGVGDLALPVQSLSELRETQELLLTVTLPEEMDVAIAAPQLVSGVAGPTGSQREATLTAQGNTVTSRNAETITLPANQAMTLELTLDALRPVPFVPDGYLYSVELSFTPTTGAGPVTTYAVNFAGSVAAACLQDGVTAGTLMPSLVNGLDSSLGVAGAIANLRCNTNMTVTANTAASTATPAVGQFASCNVTFDQSALLDCDGSTAALLGQGGFPLGLADVDLALENYQAGMLPAGSYNYVVTLTFTP